MNPQDSSLTAILVGYLLDEAQAELDRLRTVFAGDQKKPAKKLGRPSKKLNAKGEPIKSSWWAKLSPEDRSKEMHRRAMVAQGKSKSKNLRPYMRQKTDEKHAASAKQSRANQTWWSKATPAQRKKRLAAMAAGKTPKPNGAAVSA